jgi:hypothetical protein
MRAEFTGEIEKKQIEKQLKEVLRKTISIKINHT